MNSATPVNIICILFFCLALLLLIIFFFYYYALFLSFSFIITETEILCFNNQIERITNVDFIYIICSWMTETAENALVLWVSPARLYPQVIHGCR